jgi:hypothetical protein
MRLQMKKNVMFILLFACCITAFCQEKHPYEYGRNNASKDFKIRGLFSSQNYRVRIFVMKPQPELPDSVNEDGVMKPLPKPARFIMEDNIETVFDQYIHLRPGDEYLTVKDIPAGVYAIGMAHTSAGMTYRADPEKQLWGARAYNWHFTNPSTYININSTDNE